tara:strand:+ start:2238 stop:2804 length:567 start_codon:yes stop_codon:yes gene_type:complete
MFFAVMACVGLLISVVGAHEGHNHAPMSKVPTSRPSGKVKKVVKKKYARPWSPREDCSGLYGTVDKKYAQKVTLSELMKNTDAYKGKFIEVSGVVKDVCRVKGCWMMLTDGTHLMRVRFKGYKFFVPKNSIGYGVTVRGYGRKSVLSARMARHYALDAGDKEAAKKIKGPQKVVAFTASSVWMFKIKK